MRIVRLGALVGLVVGLLVTAVVAMTLHDESDGEVLVASARFPSAMVALPDGGLLYAERLTGRIRRVDADGELDPEAVAEVDTEGGNDQRGLLGVEVDGEGRIFAAWTRADDGRLVVGQVAPGEERLIWEGPESAVQANGGRLEFGPSGGGLTIGVGDLTEPDLTDDPDTPNGKLLVLDPDGEDDQVPTVISSGWNNPFSYASTPGGELWVADNAPPSRSERLARSGPESEPDRVLELPGNAAPSGVAALSDTRLAVCGYLTEEILFYGLGPDGPPVVDPDERIEGCTLGVIVLVDGRLAYADEDTIYVR